MGKTTPIRPGFELDNYNYEEVEEFEKIPHFHKLDETAAVRRLGMFAKSCGKEADPTCGQKQENHWKGWKTTAQSSLQNSYMFSQGTFSFWNIFTLITSVPLFQLEWKAGFGIWDLSAAFLGGDAAAVE